MSTTAPVTSTPAPAPGERRLGLLWFAFLGGAAAWSVQELVGYMVVAHACFPQLDPLVQPVPSWALPVAEAIGVVMLVMGLVALVAAIRETRRHEPDSPGFTRAAAEAHRGDALRYLAFGGVFFDLLFSALIAYNIFSLFVERTC